MGRTQKTTPEADAPFSLVVLPFLKSWEPVRIGGYRFRSTDDLDGLPAPQAQAVREVAAMLFLQDDLQVQSASYAVCAALNPTAGDPGLVPLRRLHTVLTYLYGAPHETMGGSFLGPHETSLAIFTPGRVIEFLVWPDHHTVSVAPTPRPAADHRHEVPGYAGLYNFQHSFWVAPGSRVYGPTRHITLNISQDLAHDLGADGPGTPARQLLLSALARGEDAALEPICRALDWYNAADPQVAEPDRGLLNLAVAFESLLRVPKDSKTERFSDAVSLLLGRTERLDHWARQFYDARSTVAHEGRVGSPHFKAPNQDARLGSLMLHGRQVFRLCLTTVLFGMDLARQDRLGARFVGRQERYEAICEALKSEAGSAEARILELQPLVAGLARFRFSEGDPASLGVMLAAVRAVADTLLQSGLELDPTLRDALAGLTALSRKDSEYRQLDALQTVESVLSALPFPAPDTPQRILRDLVEQVWGSLFRRYFELRKTQS